MAILDKFEDYHLSDYLRKEGSEVTFNMPREYTTAKQAYELEILRQKAPLFMDCDNIVFKEDAIRFTYLIPERFKSMNDVSAKTDVEKLQILMNLCNYFEGKSERYFTLFCPDNIYYTDSNETIFMYRGIVDLLPPSNQNSVKEYEDFKALILSLLQDKYSYLQLVQMGMDILGQDEFYLSIINAQTAGELKKILENEYDKRYSFVAKNKMAFKRNRVNIFFVVLSAVMAIMIAFTSYFAYRNIVETNMYRDERDLYEAYYMRQVDSVIELAENISPEELSDTAKLVIADALIATEDIENLKRAFNLDSTREMEVILKLIDLDEAVEIVDLTSANVKVQLYQAYYRQDYLRAIDLATTQIELINDAQARTLLARSYLMTRQYANAREIAEGMGDNALLIEILEAHYADTVRNETNPEKKKTTLETIDSMLSELENTQRPSSGLASQNTSQE